MPMVDSDAVDRIIARINGIDFNNTPIQTRPIMELIVEEVLEEVRRATVTTPEGTGTIT